MTDLPEQGGAPTAPAPDEPVANTIEADADRGQPRDPQGRFASPDQQGDQGAQQQPQGQGEPAPVAPQEPTRPPPGFVPQQAVHEARQQVDEWQRRAIAMERQMAEVLRQIEASKPKPQAQFWDSPEDYLQQQVQSQVQPLQRGQEDMREEFSRMMASEKFGEAAVSAAQRDLEARVMQNPAAMRHVYDRIMRSPHPYGELVKWHREESALSKYGSDPESYIKTEVERRLAEMTQQAPAANQQSQQQLPQSFATARNSGPRTGGNVVSGPLPLSAIMGR